MMVVDFDTDGRVRSELNVVPLEHVTKAVIAIHGNPVALCGHKNGMKAARTFACS